LSPQDNDSTVMLDDEPLDEVLAKADQGYAAAQFILGAMYAAGLCDPVYQCCERFSTMVVWGGSSAPWWNDVIGPSVSNKLAEMFVHVTRDEQDGFRHILLAAKNIQGEQAVDSSLASQGG
jgi:TPR repeat protein